MYIKERKLFFPINPILSLFQLRATTRCGGNAVSHFSNLGDCGLPFLDSLRQQGFSFSLTPTTFYSFHPFPFQWLHVELHRNKMVSLLSVIFSGFFFHSLVWHKMKWEGYLSKVGIRWISTSKYEYILLSKKNLSHSIYERERPRRTNI